MRFAAIDVGSNASRLHIVDADEPGRLSPYRALRMPVRLGHSVFQTGRLDAETLELSVAAMRRFAATMEEARVERYRAVVTASARSAENAAELIERVREEAGIRLDVVDGSEEARLVALAVASKLQLSGHCLLADLGGGSLELSEMEGSERGFMVSLPIGTVRLLEAFLSGGEPVDSRQDRLVREYVDRLLAPHRRKLRREPWDLVAGTGGNFVALAQLCPATGDSPAIDIESARALLTEMAPLSALERATQWNLKMDRADVIVPALYTVVALADLAGTSRIDAPGVGLKEGIVEELVEKHFRVWDYDAEQDKLLAGALSLGRRYHFDERHGLAVAAMACQLFDALKELHQLGAEDRAILRLAAVLHDVGDFINPASHHKHSQYIIENSELMGLSAAQRGLTATVARYHRRALPSARHASYRSLSEQDRMRVRYLAAMLRVADALDRGHRGKVEEIRIRLKRSSVLLELTTDADTALEEWTVGRKADLFEQVFDRSVRIVPRPKD
ncbi:MAG: Ppx/GppA family phosphatase [Deltaproteobacteria bacterium]|nr:Ppx/GppA family phosphatase [Deltaproteobacteria bacterium]